MNKRRDPYSATRAEPFTNREMQQLTQVSLMTLHLWRKGTATKSPLHATKAANGTVRYPVRGTLNWMRRHDIEPVVHPDDLGNEKRKKPGPLRAKRPAERAVGYH